MPLGEEKVKQQLDEPLDSIMSFRLGVGTRAALREVAKYYGIAEQDILRRFAAMLASAFQDAKSQATLGASYDELLSRTTRLTLIEFMNMPPADLRRLADEFHRAAYAMADIAEKQQKSKKKGK